MIHSGYFLGTDVLKTKYYSYHWKQSETRRIRKRRRSMSEKNEEYNDWEEYQVDISSFSKERPNGVSGFLRVKNEEVFLEACIRSCIDVLDELVVVHNECSPFSLGVLSKMEHLYPKKIKIFPYTPKVIAYHLDAEQYEKVREWPKENIHTFSAYSNYALSKTSYKYVMRIDADQIYFTNRLKQICDAYRSAEPVIFSYRELIAARIYRSLHKSYTKKPFLFKCFFKIISSFLSSYYSSFLLKLIIKYKVATSLSGINLFYKDGWYVSLGEQKPSYPRILPSFNGTRDHFIFPVSETTYFEPFCSAESDLKGERYITELMRYNEAMIDAGFCWFHLNACRPLGYESRCQVFDCHPDRYIPLFEFRKHTLSYIKKKYRPYFPLKYFEFVYTYFYDTERTFIPWSLLNSDKLR